MLIYIYMNSALYLPLLLKNWHKNWRCICLPAYEHWSAGVPGDSRRSPTEGWRASYAQHRSHSALWKLSEEEENISQQDTH